MIKIVTDGRLKLLGDKINIILSFPVKNDFKYILLSIAFWRGITNKIK